MLPAGTLTAGGFYQFQLSAAYAPGTGAPSVTPGYSVLAVLTNTPPSSGKLTVTVNGGDPVGTVLQDGYDFQCTGWVDDVSDLPLLYRRVARCFFLLSSLFASRLPIGWRHEFSSQSTLQENCATSKASTTRFTAW